MTKQPLHAIERDKTPLQLCDVFPDGDGCGSFSRTAELYISFRKLWPKVHLLDF